MQDSTDRYRARSRNLAVVALVLWFVFALMVPWFAPQLDRIVFQGFPLGYYMIAQGSLIAFVAIVFWHNRAQDRVDDDFGLGE